MRRTRLALTAVAIIAGSIVAAPTASRAQYWPPPTRSTGAPVAVRAAPHFTG